MLGPNGPRELNLGALEVIGLNSTTGESEDSRSHERIRVNWKGMSWDETRVALSERDRPTFGVECSYRGKDGCRKGDQSSRDLTDRKDGLPVRGITIDFDRHKIR